MACDVTKWSLIADKIPGRIGKQCRERWSNHLDPALRKGEWSKEEDLNLILAQVSSYISYFLFYSLIAYAYYLFIFVYVSYPYDFYLILSSLF